MTDSNDEIEICPNVDPHEDGALVKSKAVVKFSAVQVPVKFNRLECNTDLNLPPSNWLTTSDNSYGLHKALYHSSGFPSFRMAHMFPDCVGEVDVVSDAENIKKLLKLAYSSKSTTISMMVHKVGNTLLIDEFDVHKYLFRKADDDWRWLKTFMLETIVSLHESDGNFCLRDESREAIQTKNLQSKFLYHSAEGIKSSKKQPKNLAKVNAKPLPILGPVLPEPKIDENVPDPNSSHEFNRNVLWTFEDIRMLIGTDMPIFGGPNRPCISLRLRDTAKPINVLTGIDYWLDNLMCNVPEVVMCYHLDGIVQKYELIKTEDLPYMENCQFAPQVVRNVAQNILAFLKAKATKAGHTYWLFKGSNDDVVKLYDLTTVCKNETNCEPKLENPFTVPVAMLLYTVAKNMKNSSPKVSAKKAGSIRALLDNCIKLLPKEKYPQIVTSSHYILSDLHIPSGIDPKCPKFDSSDLDSDTQSVYEDDNFDYDPFEDEVVDESGEVAVKNICDTLKEFHLDGNAKNSSPPSPLVASVEERCRTSLKHISEGISCLQFFNCNEEEFIKKSEERAKDEEKLRILHEEQNPNMARPYKPIPLPYETLCASPREESPDTELSPQSIGAEQKLTKSKKKKLRKNKGKDVKDEPTPAPSTSTSTSSSAVDDASSKQIATKFNSQLFGSWNVHLKLLLLEKACLSYATLAEHNYLAQKFGLCLKDIYMSYRCQEVVTKYMTTMVSQKSCLFGRAGDCFLQIAKSGDLIDEYFNEYSAENEVDAIIYGEIEKDLENVENDIIEPTKNVEELMLASCQCYETALLCLSAYDEINAQNELLRRLGNVRNELGLKYMYWAQEEFTKYMATIANKTEDQTENNDNNIENNSKPKTERPLYETLATKSFDCLSRGITSFSMVRDNVNLAFLYCNMGRYMRFKAHLFISDGQSDYVQKQKSLYHEAFKYYEKAKIVLGTRKCNPELWDLVSWELSTAMFTLAKQLQDYSPNASPELEKEVIDLLQKSLKLCDTETPGAKQILYTYRSGVLHKRIASFYYNQMRSNVVDISSLPKTSLQLCKFHYEKAANILDGLKEASDYLIVQLERISLQEFLAEISPNSNHKIKHMQGGLELCLQSKALFEYSLNSLGDNPTSTDDFLRHLNLFESRLQHALKTLIKLLISGRDPKKRADCYKKMYMETLKSKAPTDNTNGALAAYLLELTNKLIQIDTECSK
ncbi:erythroid differentiation-related factor 1 [Episyrphus balteatus]|uniref:erythroid differentiation-related factor 1 n=1 Tax=Episyrphus balteatus TaxID=286459 RepID=UPI0024863BA9|nr:erythroid differentiation-related factor 1 [Episyrphus balteatus]